MTDMLSVIMNTIRGSRPSNLPESEFAAKVQKNSAGIREALRICNIHGCFEPKFVRKEVAEYLRDNFVYRVDLDIFMKHMRKFKILKEEWPV